MLEDTYLLLKIAGALIGFFVATFQLGYWLADYKYKRNALEIEKQKNQSIFSPNYSTVELTEAFRYYVRPDCAQADPSHESDFRYVADIREPVFNVLDRAVLNYENRRHFLVLADSGMGKTSLCLNYYLHRKTKYNDTIALISLSRPQSDNNIDRIPDKINTIILIDALDEDAMAIQNVNNRIYDLMQKSADFKLVIITCRSQFFKDANNVPKDTGLSIISPRGKNRSSRYPLWHLYLLPFDDRQIVRFIRSKFNILNPLNISKRRRAYQLIGRVPELSGRPMLLELVPDLVVNDAKSQELYDLYKYMIDLWINRESHWIDKYKLYELSKILAVFIHKQSIEGGGDRIPRDILFELARSVSAENSDWTHLTVRSLLNRDNDGLMKFAHRSIMEFFSFRLR